MKQITYKEKVYNIPTCWEDITLEQQLNAEVLAKDLGQELELMALISAYTEIPIDLIKQGRTEQVNEIIEALSFLNEKYLPKEITSFKFEDTTYFIEPYLVNNQFQDWLIIQNIIQNNEDNPMQGMARMVAVIAKKKDETLDDYDLDEREVLFKNLPMSVVKDIESFFLLSYQKLKLNTLLCSKEFQSGIILLKLSELKSLVKRQRKRLGRFLPTHWLIGILLIYISLKEKVLEKSSSTTPSNKSMITFKQKCRSWIMKLRRKQNKS